MSDLMQTVDGRNALIIAQRFLLERRMSRYFRRTVQIDIEQYRSGGAFDLETMLGQLNPAHDAEILLIYQLLGAVGGLQTTFSDMSYYVNGATGSDITGDGTAAKPYASTWFLENLPRRIAHKVKILIVGDLDESTKDVVLNFDFVTRSACLSIVGVGAPTVIVDDIPVGAGGSSNLRALGGDILDITTLAPINRNSFIRAKTGLDIGFTAPIYAAIAGTAVLTKSLCFANTVNGDTCQVIEPSVTWTVSSLRSMCRGTLHRSNFDGRGCPLVIANLDIEFTVYAGTILNEGNFSWKNDCPSIFSFVRLLSTIQLGAVIDGGEINTYNANDEDIDLLSLSGIANLNNGTAGTTPNICGFTLAEDSGSSVRITVKNSTVRGMHTRWTVLLDGGKESIEYGWAGLYQTRQTVFSILRSISTGQNGIDNNGGGGIDSKDSQGRISWLTVISSDNVLTLRGNCQISTHLIGSDATFSVITYAGAWMYGRNTLEIETDIGSAGDPALDGFAGATTEAAGYQSSVGLTPNAWPAVDVAVNAGNSVAYILE